VGGSCGVGAGTLAARTGKKAQLSSLVGSGFLLPFQPFPSNTLRFVLRVEFITYVLSGHLNINAGGVEDTHLLAPLCIARVWAAVFPARQRILCGNGADKFECFARCFHLGYELFLGDFKVVKHHRLLVG